MKIDAYPKVECSFKARNIGASAINNSFRRRFKVSRYFAKVLIDQEVFKQLTGSVFLTPSLVEAWAIKEIEDGSLWLHNAAHSAMTHVPILPSARALAIALSRLICQYFADHDCKRRKLSLDGQGNFIASETKLVPSKPLEGQRGQRKFKDEIGPSLNIELNQGLMLSIWNPSGEIKIEQVGCFLANSLNYLKIARNTEGADVTYSGISIAEPFAIGSSPIGWLGLWFPDENSHALNVGEYCQKVAKTFSVASMIKEFKTELPLFMERNDSSNLAPIFEALAEDDDLSALKLLIKSRGES